MPSLTPLNMATLQPFRNRVAAQRGFTLVELIMVIVILGVIGGMVSVFMRSPIDAYFDSARRAALTDVADTAVRRMARDVRKALPNSLRPTTGGSCIEFIPTKTGGRYRADDTTAGLSFDAADTSFNMLGSNAALPASQQIGRGDWIVVYNLGIPSSDAYAADSVLVPNNRTQVSATAPVPLTEPSGTGETTIPVDSKLFPLASGSKRFHVVDAAEQTLTYVCTGVGTTAAGEGSGILYRYARNFSTTHTCPTSLAGVAGASELARNISACDFVYNGSDLQRNATVQVNLSITRAGEAVSLYHEVHVNNTP